MKRIMQYVTIGLLTCVVGTGCERTAQGIDLSRALGLSNIVPILIVGSGPAGWSAALYASRSSIRTVVLAGPKPGGALTETTEVENWPGMPHVQGPDAVETVKKQAMEFGAQVMTDTVASIDVTSWPFKVMTDDGHEIYALTIIMATGSSPILLSVPGEQEYWGKGVTTCAICDAPYHKDKEVLVIGGGDSAAEEAMQLARYASRVTLCVRKDVMRASARMQERLKNYPNITISYNTQVLEIRGDGSKVTGALMKDVTTGNQYEKAVSGVFLAIGHTPNSKLLDGKVALAQSGHILMQDRTQHTSVAGILAAGDVEDDRYKQAGSAAGHGINAGLDAVSWLEDHGYNPEFAAKLAPKFFQVVKAEIVNVPHLEQYADVEKLLSENKGIIAVDFYAPYCPSCLHMLPVYQEVAAAYADRASFYKVDTSVAKEVAEKLKVFTVPTLMVFKDGKLVARFNKTLNKKQLSELIERFETVA